MSQRFYNVTLLVSERKLPLVLQTLEGEVALVRVAPQEDPSETSPAHNGKPYHYINGKRNKGILGKDLLLSILKDNISHSISTITKKFEAQGFSPNSASPLISKALAAGTIKQVSNDVYQLT